MLPFKGKGEGAMPNTVSKLCGLRRGSALDNVRNSFGGLLDRTERLGFVAWQAQTDAGRSTAAARRRAADRLMPRCLRMSRSAIERRIAAGCYFRRSVNITGPKGHHHRPAARSARKEISKAQYRCLVGGIPRTEKRAAHETARVHRAAWRCRGGVAGCGAGAADW